MDSSQGEGPDGSSIKSVSSLLARFESANKSTEALNAPHTISRPISPAPKPDKLRDFRPVAEVSSIQPGTPTVPTRPKPKIPASGTHVEPATTEQKPPAPPPPSTRPPVSVKPQVQSLQPPAVNVQPPQSPPKKNAAVVGSVDQSSYLNPDAVATASPANGSKHNFKIPNRPRTPTPALAAPRSPRPNGSQPPSPPPPRRSGEMRREAKPVPVPPPSRLGKPILQPPRAASLSSSPAPNLSSGYKSDMSPEVSPFNSPPSSTGTPEDETPPELPNRPRPRSQMVAPSRPKPAAEAFEPPPVHHAVAGHRERNGLNGGSPTKGSLTPQLTGEPRPALPARPRAEESPSRSLVAGAVLATPPKAPRSNKPVHSSASSNAQAELPPKRVSSTPSTQAVSQPSTRMQHGRSKTIDQRSSEPLGETATRSQVVIASKSSTNSTIPAGVTSTAKSEASGNITVYPDGMNSNRRPPFVKKGCYEIATKYDPRIFDICGELVCTSGQLTRVWSSLEGDLLMSLAHTEGVKATSISFKPGATPRDDGKFIWIGMNSGDLMEVELTTQRLTVSKPHVHGRFEVTNIFRHFNELWTLDESGSLLVWGPGEDGVPNISSMPTQSFRVPRQHSFAMVVGDELWHATGKEMRVFLPTLDGRSQFQVLVRPLTADGAGDITSGTTIKSHPNKVFLGHSDGKISIYSTTDYTLLGIISVSTWKINALAGVGNNLWAAYNLGKICVYDVDQNPWVILKEWQAHDHPVVKMKADVFSAYHMDRSQVLSLGADNKIKVWDGLLQDDWLEEELKARDTQYCDFEEIRALVLTWNAGATTPHSLRYSENDSNFFQNLIQTSDAPEILIFGFQELVDLEDKRATAKRFFKTSKKKEGPDQEHMSHQYRDWRDFLMKSLDDYMPADNLYYLLHTAPLVGLFTCVFVKASLRERISNLNAAEIKRGMGGLHGNKGAVAVRFQIDDSSLCFVNCHLAAGQTQANARHNDIAAILETNVFPSARDPEARLDSYCGGGDGTLIIDHELCILNGDLNYRIDTMSRDTVVMAVKQKNLAKLLERDQLLVARRRNPAFRLRAFEELPITFAPTYKYDVGTDTYDTSEKRRSPAWCDRLLFRGRGRMQQMDYLRHEVRVSDHRPVSGSFHMWVKKVDPRGRAETWMQCQQEFEDIRQRETGDEKLRYLMNVCGYDEATSRAHLKDLAKVRRSPSRAREAPPERH